MQAPEVRQQHSGYAPTEPPSPFPASVFGDDDNENSTTIEQESNNPSTAVNTHDGTLLRATYKEQEPAEARRPEHIEFLKKMHQVMEDGNRRLENFESKKVKSTRKR